jgi:hypothetical protein
MFGSIPSGNMELIGEIRCDEEGEEQEEQVEQEEQCTKCGGRLEDKVGRMQRHPIL